MELDVTHIILLMLIAAGAGFVQRVSGFGFGIFAMLFLPSLMPVASAAAISTLLSCCSSSYNTVRNRKSIPFRTLLPLMISALVTIPLAVMLSKHISNHFFKKLLGVVLILLSIYFLFFNQKIKIKASVPNGLIAGALSGMLSGLFSTGGPPVVLYLTQATATNLSYFAATQCFFSLTGIYSSVMRIINGIITWQVLFYAVFGIIGCMIGNWLGKFVFDKLDAKKLKTVIYIGMCISGLLMIM